MTLGYLRHLLEVIDRDWPMQDSKNVFEKLINTMAQLRGPKGCPWDKKQTHESLKACLLEETYEVLEAIDAQDPSSLREELGDLLLQVIFHAQIANEMRNFDITEIVEGLNDKLIRRHPHVFAEGETKAKALTSTKDPEAAIRHWEKVKSQEKRGGRGLFAGIPKELPALLRAYRMGSKAARVGFDWTQLKEVWKKVEEELEELHQATVQEGSLSDSQEAIEEELGDLLFSLAQVGRFLKVNPEEALRKATLKFQKRFEWMEAKLKVEKQDLHQLDAEMWEQLWQEAKLVGTNPRVRPAQKD